MPQLPTEREISFEMPSGSTTTLGYDPQALDRCLAPCAGTIDPLKLHFPKDRKDVDDVYNTLMECVCPSLYAFECEAIYFELPLTKESLDDLPFDVLARITKEVLIDFSALTSVKEQIN